MNLLFQIKCCATKAKGFSCASILGSGLPGIDKETEGRRVPFVDRLRRADVAEPRGVGPSGGEKDLKNGIIINASYIDLLVLALGS